jgi:hypothetical protein
VEDNVKEIFEVCGGSVTGRMHLQPFGIKNNQDAFAWHSEEEFTIAVVSDGCGSGVKSEVGANLAAPMLIHQIKKLHPVPLDLFSAERLLAKARRRMLVQFSKLISSLGGDLSRTVLDYFLFSLLGVIVSRTTTVVFSLGDGVFYLNGERTQLGPYPDNAPPYLNYSLVRTNIAPELLRFQIQRVLPTEHLQSVLVGTDGVADLEAKASHNLPSQNEAVGEVSQFWENDRFYKNPDAVRRRLALINHEHISVVEGILQKTSGHLPDDTTLIALRRKKV